MQDPARAQAMLQSRLAPDNSALLAWKHAQKASGSAAQSTSCMRSTSCSENLPLF